MPRSKLYAEGGIVDRIGNREREIDRLIQRSIEDRGGVTRDGVLKIPIDKLKPKKFAKGGMVSDVYAKKLPAKSAMMALDKTQRTINDYAKLTPMTLKRS